MTEQVKRARRQMKEAGFVNSEFRCRVETHIRRGCREYGEAHVVVWDNALIGKRIDAILAAGLGVYHHNKTICEFWLIRTDYNSKGRLAVAFEATE